MLKEAIESLAGLVKRGEQPHVQEVPGRPLHTLVSYNGKSEWWPHEPTPRAHTVDDLDSLIAIAKRFADSCTVWHSRDEVVVVLDDDMRHEAATFRLEESSAWSAAMDLQHPTSQAVLLEAFRGSLKDVVLEADPGLIGLFSNVRFKRRDESSATIDHGRESMGRDLERTVTGADKLPEEVAFTLRPYVAVESESEVRFALRVRYTEEKFQFLTVGDDVQTAIDLAQYTIRSRFDGVTDRVYYGTP